MITGNQCETKVKTSNFSRARENVGDRIKTSISFASDWLRLVKVFLRISGHNEAKTMQVIFLHITYGVDRV